jgi:hypothetical protein
MRRRIQGFAHQAKQDNGDSNQTEAKVPEYTQRPSQTEQSSDAEVIRIPQEKLVSGIVAGLANTSAAPYTPRKKTNDVEVSEELITQVIDQYQKQKSQQPENTGNRNQETGQQQNSQRNNLHAIIAKYLLGKSSTENQQSGENNPILIANNMANQQSNQSSNQQSTNQQSTSQQSTNQQSTNQQSTNQQSNNQQSNNQQNNNQQSNNQQSNNQQGNNQQGGSQQSLIKSDITAKMASQVLAEAQYELANELETSLNKLQRVIEESKQIAQKISSILAQQNGNSGNNNN